MSVVFVQIPSEVTRVVILIYEPSTQILCMVPAAKNVPSLLSTATATNGTKAIVHTKMKQTKICEATHC